MLRPATNTLKTRAFSFGRMPCGSIVGARQGALEGDSVPCLVTYALDCYRGSLRIMVTVVMVLPVAVMVPVIQLGNLFPFVTRI